jgi:hypothetical protein
MSKRQKLAYALAVIGAGITLAIFAYLEMTDYAPFQPTLIAVTLILCPASALSAGFLVIQPHSGTAVFAWLLIAALNGAPYGAIGCGVGKYLKRA